MVSILIFSIPFHAIAILFGVSLFWIPFAIWFLYVWSKSIAEIEKISESKITLVVILFII